MLTTMFIWLRPTVSGHSGRVYIPRMSKTVAVVANVGKLHSCRSCNTYIPNLCVAWMGTE